MSKPDWRKIRSEFPALCGENSARTYLNTATFGQLPRRATEAVERHWQHRDKYACADFLDWYDDADRIRAKVAKLIGATADDIAFVPHAAAALGIIIAGLCLKPDENIVTLESEFPNQLYIPQVREVSWEKLFDAVDEHTRMIALSEVNYATGFRVPLNEVSIFACEREIILFVDGTQSTGALLTDLGNAQGRVHSVHGYKWMISPTGAGFLYISPDLRQEIPANSIGWRSHKTWRNVDNLHHGAPEFKDTAEKYEGGGLPFPLLYAMEASIDLMFEIGPEVIEARVLELAKLARENLRALGADVSENKSQIVAAQFPGHDPSKIAKALRERNVIVSARHGFLRISPHFYNDEEDLERMESALKSVLNADQK